MAIDAGGLAAGIFLADTDFMGGGTATTGNAINTAGVVNPAPPAIYQSERAGQFTYTLPSFVAGSTHTVRLHFAEFYFQQVNQRVFNVSINGTKVLPNFDIVAAAGGLNKLLSNSSPLSRLVDKLAFNSQMAVSIRQRLATSKFSN